MREVVGAEVYSQGVVTRVLHIFDAHETPEYRAWPPMMDWIRRHGADPDRVRRVEVLLLDCPLVRLFEAVVDEDGHYVIEGDEWAETTRDVLLREDPPLLAA